MARTVSEEFPLIIIILPFAAIISLLILEWTGVLNLVSLTTPLTAPNFSKVIQAAGSLTFSFALALLYYRQTKVQKKQERWMEADHTPKLAVEEWSVNKNEITVFLTNMGNGVAENIGLAIKLSTVKGYEMNPDQEPGLLLREDILATAIKGGVIEPVEFNVIPELNSQYYTTKSDGTFSDVVSELAEYEDEIRVDVELSYEYISQKANRQRIWSANVDISEDSDFEAAVLSVVSTNESEIDLAPTNASGPGL